MKLFLPLKNIHTCLAKLDIPENTAFITMGINCILIELFYEMKMDMMSPTKAVQ